jgi:urease accessory protein
MSTSPALASRAACAPNAAPPSLAAAHGSLALRFRPDRAGRTQVDVLEQQPPLRMVRAFTTADDGALVHLHNISGGVLGGDQLTQHFAVAEGAKAQLTTTGATRVYRHRDGQPDAMQTTDIRVARGALLEYLPDPLIPFAGARYDQRTRFELAQGATLFAWDVISPGREARGEVFAYEQLALHTEIVADGRPLAVEHALLTPATVSPASPLGLGRYRTFATFYVCRPGEDPQVWRALEQQLSASAAAQSTPGATVWGVSTLAAGGLVVRGIAHQGRALVVGLPHFWGIAKQALCHTAAIMPRKIY